MDARFSDQWEKDDGTTKFTDFVLLILLPVHSLNGPRAVGVIRFLSIVKPIPFYSLFLLDLLNTFLGHEFGVVVTRSPRPARGSKFTDPDQSAPVDRCRVPSGSHRITVEVRVHFGSLGQARDWRDWRLGWAVHAEVVGIERGRGRRGAVGVRLNIGVLLFCADNLQEGLLEGRQSALANDTTQATRGCIPFAHLWRHRARILHPRPSPP